VSLAWRIGRCIALAEATNTMSSVAEAIVEVAGGEKSARILFRGKITQVERRLSKGHSYGSITIAGEEDEEEGKTANRMPAVKVGGTLKIPFKNENIYAEHTSDSGVKEHIAVVPDLIAVILSSPQHETTLTIHTGTGLWFRVCAGSARVQVRLSRYCRWHRVLSTLEWLERRHRDWRSKVVWL
jgi:DUF917 family protein